MTNRETGLTVGGALLGLALTLFVKSAFLAKPRKYEKKYRAYRDKVRAEQEGSVFGFKRDETVTFLGIEIADKCSCGKKVKPYDEQKLVINETGDRWYRLCRYCIHTP